MVHFGIIAETAARQPAQNGHSLVGPSTRNQIAYFAKTKRVGGQAIGISRGAGLANVAAVCAPSPEPPPVTIAACPCGFIVGLPLPDY